MTAMANALTDALTAFGGSMLLMVAMYGTAAVAWAVCEIGTRFITWDWFAP